MSSALDRLKDLTSKITSYELARKENSKQLRKLFIRLHIDEKVADFDDIFDYKAINLSGFSLNAEELGAVREGKYAQIIAISYDKDAVVKNKNVSLAYFGRAEKVEAELREEIVRFILCWRFEKSFRTLEHYHTMIRSLKSTGDA